MSCVRKFGHSLNYHAYVISLKGANREGHVTKRSTNPFHSLKSSMSAALSPLKLPHQVPSQGVSQSPQRVESNKNVLESLYVSTSMETTS
jgi:hypothetical protein